MKNLLRALLIVLLFSGSLFAADMSKSLKFEWEQAAGDLPNLKEWGVYMMATSGGEKVAPIAVPYASGTGPFQTSQSFTVTGSPGATVRKYFVLDAVSKSGNRSGYSNEVFADFVIPFADVTTPMTLKVTIIVTP